MFCIFLILIAINLLYNERLLIKDFFLKLNDKEVWEDNDNKF